MTPRRLPAIALLSSAALLACGDAGRADPIASDTTVGSIGGSSGDASSGASTDAGSDGGEDTDAPPPPDAGVEPPPMHGGPVHLDGRSFADDGGPFVALGATTMWAAWAWRHDRPRLERALEVLSNHGFHYVRALGVVGDPNAEDYWDGREIALGWPDYDEVIAGVSALAYDGYGLRVEWTLVGDGQITVPEPAQRDDLVDRFVALAAARPETIVHLELANEAWQNGFGGDDGLAELRSRTEDLRARTDVLVAASAPPSDACADLLSIYGGDVADLATVHTDRDLGTAAGPWAPVVRPWVIAQCEGVPALTNNEPIGPGASVASEDDPERLVAAALASWISGMPAYVFHTHAGVLGFDEIADAPGVDAFAPIVAVLDGDLASWTRRAHDDPGGALRMFVEVDGTQQPDLAWPDVPGATAGVVALMQTESGPRTVALAVGVLGTATFEARVALDLEVVDILTAQIVDARPLAAGERFTLGGAGARLLRAARL